MAAANGSAWASAWPRRPDPSRRRGLALLAAYLGTHRFQTPRHSARRWRADGSRPDNLPVTRPKRTPPALGGFLGLRGAPHPADARTAAALDGLDAAAGQSQDVAAAAVKPTRSALIRHSRA